jgi:putative endonuclease
MKKDRRKATGQTGEQFVLHDYLQEGYRLLEKNWRQRRGEIDLIFISPANVLVFVEVRSRLIHFVSEFTQARVAISKQLIDEAIQSITPSKQKTIRELATQFLQHHPLFHRYVLRFDIVICLLQSNDHHCTTDPLQVHLLHRLEEAF